MIRLERVDDNNSTIYWIDGKIHRPNGPAIIWNRRRQWAWWLFGDAHRYYGPQNQGGDWCIRGRWV
jgi:hypothetical protein